MPKVCLGMSVVCPGMPGCICTPGTFVSAKNSFGEYAGGMSGYVQVYPGVSASLVCFSAQKTCLAGMPEVCLYMSGYIRVSPVVPVPLERFSAQKLV